MKYTKVIVFLLLGLCGCIPEPENSNIPNRSVNFLIDTSLSGSDYTLHDDRLGMTKIYTKQRPATLSPKGSYGYSGVIVVRTLDNQLCAFDICCTYEAKQDIALQGSVGDFFLTCPRCGSTFEVGNGLGIVNKGPAIQRLKRYKVEQRGSEKYYIRN